MSLSRFPACCCCEEDDAEAADETAVSPSSTFLMLNFLMALGGGAPRSAGLAAPGAAASTWAGRDGTGRGGASVGAGLRRRGGAMNGRGLSEGRGLA